MGSCTTGDLTSAGLWLQGNTAYFVGPYDGLYIIDVTDPHNPSTVKVLSGVSSWGCCVRDSLLYFSAFDESLHIWNIANLYNVQQLGAVHVAGAGNDVKVLGNYAYVGATGLGLVDVGDPRNPALKAYYSTPDNITRVVCDSPYVYAACYSGGICIFDTTSTAVAERSEVQVRPAEVRVVGSVTNGRAIIVFSGIARKEVDLQVFDMAGNRLGRADVLAYPGTACCHRASERWR